jgi:predicted Zn finger-like uncharacterized protein
MIEIQCTSCHTRYRIDERVLPDDTPTFKCSRCGHVFNADPVPPKVRKPAPVAVERESESRPRTIRAARPLPGAFKSPVESDVVKREPAAPPRQVSPPRSEIRAEQSEAEQRPTVEHRMAEAHAEDPANAPEDRPAEDQHEPNIDNPLNRLFGERDQKTDTGENLKFDFSDERNQIGEEPPEQEFERSEPHDGGWQVGDVPDEFESAPRRRAPTMMAEPEPAPRPTPTPVRRMASTLLAEVPRIAAPPAGPAKDPGFQLGQVADASADDAPAEGTHASGVFLATFFLVAIIFFGASALICGEPAASARLLSQAPRIGGYFARPIVPAMLVALHDVRSEYYTLKGGHVALVITGNAQNVGARPLHIVEIDAALLGDGAHPIASQRVYCGNELSAQMLGEMTPREIEFSQGLSPQKAFAMEPSASAPFLMVFIDPPAGASKIRIAVSKAMATAPDSSATAAPPT